MTGKRKRRRASNIGPGQPGKRIKLNAKGPSSNVSMGHPALCLYYPHVVTLQEYLLSKLPATSVSRREKIATIGREEQRPLKVDQSVSENEAQQASRLSDRHVEGECRIRDRERNLAKLLKTTLIGLLNDLPPDVATSRQKDFVSFSQQVNLISGSSVGGASTTQSEVGFDSVQPSDPCIFCLGCACLSIIFHCCDSIDYHRAISNA